MFIERSLNIQWMFDACSMFVQQENAECHVTEDGRDSKMDDAVNEILEGLAPKPPRSRLDPHATLIEEMHRRGWTYREIARVLAEKCQVRTSPSNIYYFLQLRARKARQAGVQRGRKPSAKQTADEPAGFRIEPTVSPNGVLPDVAQRIAALKNRNAVQANPAGFSFDPDEPLRLTGPGKPGRDDG